MANTVTIRTVRKIGLGLPDVQATTTFGGFALKVGGKLMACVPTHKSAEPGSLMVRADYEQIKALVDEAPDAYYVPEHYAGYNAVLVRLGRITPEVMRDLLGMAHKFVSGKKTLPSSRPKRR